MRRLDTTSGGLSPKNNSMTFMLRKCAKNSSQRKKQTAYRILKLISVFGEEFGFVLIFLVSYHDFDFSIMIPFVNKEKRILNKFFPKF